MQGLQTPPSIWQELDLEKRDDIHKFLWRNDSTAENTTIYDKRGVEDLSRTFEIELEQAQDILAYFYAATRDKADLEYDINKCRTSFHSDKSSRRLDNSPQVRSPARSLHLDKPSSMQDFSMRIYRVNFNEVPRIKLPLHLEEKYELEESSNFEDDIDTPCEVYRISTKRSTGNNWSKDLSVDSDGSSVDFIRPSLLDFGSLDALSTCG